jgi:hypothetical protein
MSFDVLGQVNWLAVLVGAVLYFALGAAWYAPPLFGRRWQKAIGWDPQRTPPQMSATSYAVPLLTYLVIAAAIAMIAAATGSDTLGEGIVLGLVVGIGLFAMHTLGDAVFDPNKPEPWVWFAITATYHVVGVFIVSVLVAIWH